jgi:hypothetical protein
MREMRRIQDTVRGELDSVLHPDISPNFDQPDQPDRRDPEPVTEPGDHTAIATETGSTEIAGPDDGATAAPDADHTTDRADSRFAGPTDSFI